MNLTFSHVRTILTEVPRHAKLAYCLLRDPRVPTAPKVAVLAAVGLILSPLDLPAWLPVAGELDMLALGILAVKVFVDACPDELVAEHRQALTRGESVWDRDRRAMVGGARRGVTRAVEGWRARRLDRAKAG
jgi:uncharacterized membrane protein YkvA (DUF1232 family)